MFGWKKLVFSVRSVSFGFRREIRKVGFRRDVFQLSKKLVLGPKSLYRVPIWFY